MEFSIQTYNILVFILYSKTMKKSSFVGDFLMLFNDDLG